MNDERLARPGRVLVVDEDAAFTLAVRKMLEDVGYDVVECNDANDALVRLVADDAYDVILCEAQTRAGTAFEFRDRVAAVDPALSERIVFMATEPLERIAPTLLLVKPFELHELLSRVEEFVVLRTMPPLRPSRFQ